MSNKASQRKRNYQKIDVNDDSDIDNENDPLKGLNSNKIKGNETDKETPQSKTSNIEQEEKMKPKTFCEWLFSNPLSKGPFLYFAFGILATLGDAVFHFMDNDTSYIISGILGASICFYGLKHFYTLLGLKASIDKMSQLNFQFHSERRKLSREVDRIGKANNHLRQTHGRLMMCNERNRQNLDQFRSIQDNMNKFGKQSVEELQDVLGKSKAIESKWHDQLYEHERNLLHTVFERVERQGSRMGMNASEFEEFEKQLPDEYKRRFDRMGTFHHLSKGQSLIQYDDFRCVLDVFAEMATDNVDIEFEIQKSPRSKRRRKQSSKQIKYRNMDQMEPVSEENEASSFIFQPQIGTPNITIEPHVSKLQETESIDLEDIKFDEDSNSDEDDIDDAPQLYERKVVVTKRTIRGSRFREDLSMAALMDDAYDNDYGSDSDIDAEERLFGSVKLKTVGRKQFADLLNDNDDQ